MTTNTEQRDGPYISRNEKAKEPTEPKGKKPRARKKAEDTQPAAQVA